MLTVFSVLWGDKYNPGYVYALRDMVKDNLTIEHEFKCVTTQHLPGIYTINPFVPYSGWWQKIGLFAPGIATGPSLYFDLDVVITRNIDYLAEYTRHTFAAPANWGQSGHGGIQSSVMAWGGNWYYPYERIKDQWPSIRERLWGDQEFLTEILDDCWERIPGIGSYKYHARPINSMPDDIKVLVFHGKPDPHEVNDPWILPFTRTLRSLIN